MRSAGVICEYNPFHSSHAHHLQRTREETGADLIVCVMSGEFTQRGEPAICDKWTRARMALAGGADVVVELPFAFAVRSAEHFARGAVLLLDALNVDFLSFGAEATDLDRLRQIARVLSDEPADFRLALQQGLDKGLSYAHARREAAAAVAPWAGPLLNGPNNLLAIEYLRSINAAHSEMRPHAIARTGSGHDKPWQKGQHPSSSAVRSALLHSPLDAEAICRDAGVPETIEPAAWETPLFTLIAGKLRNMGPAALSDLPDMEHGLEWRIMRAAREATSIQELLNGIKTRRYPAARIRRLLLYALFDLTRERLRAMEENDMPLYAHVLAVRRERLREFGELCRNSSTRVAPSPKGLPHSEALSLDLRASDTYGLLMNPVRAAGADYTTPLTLSPALPRSPHG